MPNPTHPSKWVSSAVESTALMGKRQVAWIVLGGTESLECQPMLTPCGEAPDVYATGEQASDSMARDCWMMARRRLGGNRSLHPIVNYKCSVGETAAIVPFSSAGRARRSSQ
jgi:hypothetical protein